MIQVRLWLSFALLAQTGIPGSATAQVGEIAAKRSAVKASPRSADAYDALGVAELRAGHFNESKRAFEAAAALDKGNPRRVMRVAEAAIARGDYKAAKALCRKLFPQRGDPPAVAHVCMARAHLAWSRSARAFEDLELALSLDAASTDAQLVLGHAHRLRAQVSDSEAAYLKALQDPRLAAEANLGLAKLYAAASKQAEAVRSLREVLGQEPAWPEAQLELGMLLRNTDEGRALLAAALEGRPGWADAARALADARREAGDLAGAETAYRQAVLADVHSAPAHAGLGEVLYRTGRFDEAQTELQKSLTLVANNARAALLLAEVFHKQGKLEEAIEQFRHAADLDLRDPTSLLRAGELLLAEKRTTLATGFLDRLLEAHPELSAGLKLYGDVMVERGDKGKARTYYERALLGRGSVDRAAIQQALGAL